MKKIVTILAILLTAIPRLAIAETYVVAVGIANYQNISPLTLSEDDALTIARIYKTRTKHVITMTGKYATKANITKALRDQFARAKEKDMVVFYFSGHGYEGGFCPYDMTNANKNALSYKDIYAVFRKCKAKRKVVLADACMAGGLRQEPDYGAPSQNDGSDVVMFLSSRTKETSLEDRSRDNSIFTDHLERGLRGGADSNHDRLITARELFTFVSREVKSSSNNRQHPVMWGSFDDNFIMMNWKK